MPGLREAIRASTVAIDHEVARRVGAEREAGWLDRPGHGDGEAGPVVERFRLGGPLEISPLARAEWPDRVAERSLPAPRAAQDATAEITLVENGPAPCTARAARPPAQVGGSAGCPGPPAAAPRSPRAWTRAPTRRVTAREPIGRQMLDALGCCPRPRRDVMPVVDFAPSAVADDYTKRMRAFLDEEVLPAEAEYEAFRAERRGTPQEWDLPPVVERLKADARSRGLWNLFLPSVSGLSNLDYAQVAEVSGWSPVIAPEAINCQAPDTGNMETLHLFATPEQRAEWLEPLLEGTIRSGFAMTEPDVASSDATNVQTRIVRDGDDYVINGRKWWISGAADERCRIFIVMGKTDPDAAAHRQQSMVLVPRDTPGLEIVRHLPTFGYQDQHGHSELVFRDVRVPVTNLLGEEGGGFAIAQARLGPGRIHHCMRLIGMAERAIDLMVRRAQGRVAFGRPLADQGVVREQIAQSRIEVEQARLLVHKTAWLIDRYGAKGAATEIAAIKVVTPRIACDVVDRAIQVHGGAGMSDDTPLAYFYVWARALRLADGPDEVHLRTVARQELGRHR